jgi:tetratricopeptide (TPR) repeat protein
VFSQKAEILEKMGKPSDADLAMKDAIKAANNANQIHAYARRLLNEKKSDKAFEYFKLNYDKFPDVYTTNVGMARGYEALGNKKQALKYATKALPQAPDSQNKAVIEEMIKSLKEGKVVKS